MISAIQKKFVITAMVAITVLVLFLLGAINVANMLIVGNEIDRTLRVISENEGGEGNQMPRPEFARPDLPVGVPKNDYDTFMSSNFFVVRFDRSGDVVHTDVSRTSTVSEEAAVELAQEIYRSGGDSGKAENFRYIVKENYIRSEKSVFFLDISAESFSYIRVLLLSVGAGAVCWGLMLLFVIMLSRRAIRPIAENIEKQKQFVTNAGHEIKTPLAIIQSNTEAMEMYNGENKWSRNIREQTVRLGGLMNNLLTLARMDEGRAKANVIELDLSTALEDVVRSFMQPMEEKDITFKVEIQNGVYLNSDRTQMEQLLSILLDNAVKYTDESGEIWIYLQKNGKHTRLRIENTCKNLPDVPPDKLFDRFYRGDASRTQKSGGYGVGLAIARSFADANGGALRAEYIASDRICFTVEF